MPEKFNECRIEDGKVVKILRTVSIDQRDADMLNLDEKVTHVRYELAEKAPARDELFAILEERGIKMPKNAKTEALIAKIEETNPSGT